MYPTLKDAFSQYISIIDHSFIPIVISDDILLGPSFNSELIGIITCRNFLNLSDEDNLILKVALYYIGQQLETGNASFLNTDDTVQLRDCLLSSLNNKIVGNASMRAICSCLGELSPIREQAYHWLPSILLCLCGLTSEADVSLPPSPIYIADLLVAISEYAWIPEHFEVPGLSQKSIRQQNRVGSSGAEVSTQIGAGTLLSSKKQTAVETAAIFFKRLLSELIMNRFLILPHSSLLPSWTETSNGFFKEKGLSSSQNQREHDETFNLHSTNNILTPSASNNINVTDIVRARCLEAVANFCERSPGLLFVIPPPSSTPADSETVPAESIVAWNLWLSLAANCHIGLCRISDHSASLSMDNYGLEINYSGDSPMTPAPQRLPANAPALSPLSATGKPHQKHSNSPSNLPFYFNNETFANSLARCIRGFSHSCPALLGSQIVFGGVSQPGSFLDSRSLGPLISVVCWSSAFMAIDFESFSGEKVLGGKLNGQQQAPIKLFSTWRPILQKNDQTTSNNNISSSAVNYSANDDLPYDHSHHNANDYNPEHFISINQNQAMQNSSDCSVPWFHHSNPSSHPQLETHVGNPVIDHGYERRLHCVEVILLLVAKLQVLMGGLNGVEQDASAWQAQRLQQAFEIAVQEYDLVENLVANCILTDRDGPPETNMVAVGRLTPMIAELMRGEIAWHITEEPELRSMRSSNGRSLKSAFQQQSHMWGLVGKGKLVNAKSGQGKAAALNNTHSSNPLQMNTSGGGVSNSGNNVVGASKSTPNIVGRKSTLLGNSAGVKQSSQLGNKVTNNNFNSINNNNNSLTSQQQQQQSSSLKATNVVRKTSSSVLAMKNVGSPSFQKQRVKNQQPDKMNQLNKQQLLLDENKKEDAKINKSEKKKKKKTNASLSSSFSLSSKDLNEVYDDHRSSTSSDGLRSPSSSSIPLNIPSTLKNIGDNLNSDDQHPTSSFSSSTLSTFNREENQIQDETAEYTEATHNKNDPINATTHEEVSVVMGAKAHWYSLDYSDPNNHNHFDDHNEANLLADAESEIHILNNNVILHNNEAEISDENPKNQFSSLPSHISPPLGLPSIRAVALGLMGATGWTVRQAASRALQLLANGIPDLVFMDVSRLIQPVLTCQSVSPPLGLMYLPSPTDVPPGVFFFPESGSMHVACTDLTAPSENSIQIPLLFMEPDSVCLTLAHRQVEACLLVLGLLTETEAVANLVPYLSTLIREISVLFLSKQILSPVKSTAAWTISQLTSIWSPPESLVSPYNSSECAIGTYLDCFCVSPSDQFFSFSNPLATPLTLQSLLLRPQFDPRLHSLILLSDALGDCVSIRQTLVNAATQQSGGDHLSNSSNITHFALSKTLSVINSSSINTLSRFYPNSIGLPSMIVLHRRVDVLQSAILGSLASILESQPSTMTLRTSISYILPLLVDLFKITPSSECMPLLDVCKALAEMFGTVISAYTNKDVIAQRQSEAQGSFFKNVNNTAGKNNSKAATQGYTSQWNESKKSFASNMTNREEPFTVTSSNKNIDFGTNITTNITSSASTTTVENASAIPLNKNKYNNNSNNINNNNNNTRSGVIPSGSYQAAPVDLSASLSFPNAPADFTVESESFLMDNNNEQDETAEFDDGNDFNERHAFSDPHLAHAVKMLAEDSFSSIDALGIQMSDIIFSCIEDLWNTLDENSAAPPLICSIFETLGSCFAAFGMRSIDYAELFGRHAVVCAKVGLRAFSPSNFHATLSAYNYSIGAYNNGNGNNNNNSNNNKNHKMKYSHEDGKNPDNNSDEKSFNYDKSYKNPENNFNPQLNKLHGSMFDNRCIPDHASSLFEIPPEDPVAIAALVCLAGISEGLQSNVLHFMETPAYFGSLVTQLSKVNMPFIHCPRLFSGITNLVVVSARCSIVFVLQIIPITFEMLAESVVGIENAANRCLEILEFQQQLLEKQRNEMEEEQLKDASLQLNSTISQQQLINDDQNHNKAQMSSASRFHDAHHLINSNSNPIFDMDDATAIESTPINLFNELSSPNSAIPERLDDSIVFHSNSVNNENDGDVHHNLVTSPTFPPSANSTSTIVNNNALLSNVNSSSHIINDYNINNSTAIDIKADKLQFSLNPSTPLGSNRLISLSTSKANNNNIIPESKQERSSEYQNSNNNSVEDDKNGYHISNKERLEIAKYFPAGIQLTPAQISIYTTSFWAVGELCVSITLVAPQYVTVARLVNCLGGNDTATAASNKNVNMGVNNVNTSGNNNNINMTSTKNNISSANAGNNTANSNQTTSTPVPMGSNIEHSLTTTDHSPDLDVPSNLRNITAIHMKPEEFLDADNPPADLVYFPEGNLSNLNNNNTNIANDSLLVASTFRIPFDHLVEAVSVTTRCAISALIFTAASLRTTGGSDLINHLLLHQAGSACTCDWAVRPWSEGPMRFRQLQIDAAVALGKMGLAFPSLVAPCMIEPLRGRNQLHKSSGAVNSGGLFGEVNGEVQNCNALSLWSCVIVNMPQSHEQLTAVIGILHCCDVRIELFTPADAIALATTVSCLHLPHGQPLLLNALRNSVVILKKIAGQARWTAMENCLPSKSKFLLELLLNYGTQQHVGLQFASNTPATFYNNNNMANMQQQNFIYNGAVNFASANDISHTDMAHSQVGIAPPSTIPLSRVVNSNVNHSSAARDGGIAFATGILKTKGDISAVVAANPSSSIPLTTNNINSGNIGVTPVSAGSSSNIQQQNQTNPQHSGGIRSDQSHPHGNGGLRIIDNEGNVSYEGEEDS